MKSRLALALACVATTLVAQERSTPPDLEAIAKLLEGDSKLPDVVAAWSADDLRKVVEFGALFTAEERDVMLEEDSKRDPLLAVALKEIAEAKGQPTRLGLAREIRACVVVANAADERGAADRSLRGRTVSQWPEIGERARRRAPMLCAQFLRLYPDAPEVGHLLVRVASSTRGLRAEDRKAIQAAGLRMLGADATIPERLDGVDSLLREQRWADAELALAAAEHAKPGRTIDRRSTDAARLAASRRRLVAARRWDEASHAAGLDGRIARLRVLQEADGDSAVAMAKELVAEGVEHALPSVILAADAMLRDLEDALVHAERADKLPGADSYAAIVRMTLRSMLLFRQPGTEATKKQLQEVFRDVDGAVKDEPSEIAILWRGLRANGWWSMDEKPFRKLDPLVDLARALPGCETAALTLVLAASQNEDPARGLAAMQRAAFPADTASVPATALWAAVALQLALVTDSGVHGDQVEQALTALEHAPGGEQDAEYLRGVRAWSLATRPGAAPELREDARRHFTQAKRMAFERGAFPAAWAACLVRGVDPDSHEAREMTRVRNANDAEWDQFVPYCTSLLGSDTTPRMIGSAEKLRDRVETPLARWVLSAALAEAHQKLGDSAAARAAAKRALREDISDTRLVLCSRGVLALGKANWTFRSTIGGVSSFCDAQCDLLPITPLPTRERLQELAKD